MSNTLRLQLVSQASDLVNQSGLPLKDKKLLLGRLPFAAETMLRVFVDLAQSDPFSVDRIVRSLKLKLETQGNLKKLHTIVRQERDEVERMIADRRAEAEKVVNMREGVTRET
jgi:hypothetical protein